MHKDTTTSATKATVSLAMIVRNEEARLEQCLASTGGIFDEVVVVDTGSVDSTPNIAERLGARVVRFPWIDDFSAARNVSIENASCDYIFWLDADDLIEPSQLPKLKSLFDQLPHEPKQAFVFKCVCDPSSDGGGGGIVVDHVRLFPRDDRIRWVYSVHEQILPALLHNKIEVCWTDILIRHTGYSDTGTRERKRIRDLAILQKDLEKRPNDAFVLFNIGSILFEREQWREALEYFSNSNACLVRSTGTESLRRKLYGMLAWTNQVLGAHEESIRICDEGLFQDPTDAELWFRKAVAHRYRGESITAEACWHRILGLPKPTHFSSIDKGICGHLTRRNLALIASERGDVQSAASLWEQILMECPGDPDAMRQLGLAKAA